MSVEQLRSEALKLSPDERAALAEQLLASLDSPDQMALDAAWAREAEDRRCAYEAGQLKGTPAEEVFSKLEKRPR